VCLNQDMTALIPDEEITSEYLAYLVQGLESHLLTEWVKQGATVESIEHDRMANTPVPIPSRRSQLAITSYLNTETARVDELISRKTELIDILLEMRSSIVAEHVSGMHGDILTRDTGDPFMPHIPATWDYVSLKRFSLITNGSTPLKDNPSYWTGGTYPWMNSSVVNADEVTEPSELITQEALKRCHLPIVPARSVLIALTGQGKTRGKATVLRMEATINQHLAAIICDSEHFDSEFVFWALTAQYGALRMVSEGQGGTKGALTCEELGRFKLPKPPVQAQKDIARRLYQETQQIDALILHTKRESTALLELRQTTITDAVLGRINVREAVNYGSGTETYA
jgi:type I restriction enzyme S subunit